MQYPNTGPSDRFHFDGEAPSMFGDEPLSGKDPYRPALAFHIVLVLLTLALLTAVVMIQRPVPRTAETKEQAARGLEKHSEPSFESMLFAKMYFATRAMAAGMDQSWQQNADALAEFEIAGQTAPTLIKRKPEDPLPPASTRLHAAILAGETLGKDAAIQRLDETAPQIDPMSLLSDDLSLLRRIYEGEPPADVAAALTEDQRKQFVNRHGIFGELALSYGDEDAQVRKDAASSGMIVLLTGFAFGFGVFAACFVGFGLLIYLMIQLGGRRLRPRFAAPHPVAAAEEGPTAWGWSMDPQGRLVWLETVAVFIAGFLALNISGDLLHNVYGSQTWLAFYSLIGQWLLLLTIFWPVVRGMPLRRWRGEIGWHRGEGFLREIGSGLLVYIASIPVYVFTAMVVAVIIIVVQAVWDYNLIPDSEDRLQALAGSGSPLVLVLFFALATIWAPVVEESIFRGALYRHARGSFNALLNRLHFSLGGTRELDGSSLISVALSTLLTGVVFAVMHGYAPIQLIMVALLGFVFALMREWRGSLIPSMTAHFVHNAIIMTFIIVLFGQVAA